ncbi:MAG: VWA domain-containing protein [Oscillospiraceae bacterium]|nr:VWA domain-containing protein [Oscillospiraceae bacterium]
MKKNLTELVFILDRSGSMSGLERDTVGGFNSMLAKQKKEGGDAVVTTVLFDGEVELLHDRADIGGVSPLTEKDYQVGGCTALLDAMGCTIRKIRRAREHVLKEYRPDKTLFVIITDGEENASREYSSSQVKALVEQQKEDGWEFVFLGANIDAITAAGRVGIDASRAVNYHSDARGTRENFAAVSDLVGKFRAAPSCGAASVLDDGSWRASIDADYQKRK